MCEGEGGRKICVRGGREEDMCEGEGGRKICVRGREGGRYV